MRSKRLGIVLVLICLYFSVTMTSATQELIVFTGTGNVTTDTFDCYGHGKITWTTVPETDVYTTPDFYVWIWELAYPRSLPAQTFSGLSGTTHLYKNGTFYFDIIPMLIESWRITVENVELPQFELTTTIKPTETITVTETTSDFLTITRIKTTTEKTMQEFGVPVLGICVLLIALLTLSRRRKAN